jgi:hypothetical protein
MPALFSVLVLAEAPVNAAEKRSKASMDALSKVPDQLDFNQFWQTATAERQLVQSIRQLEQPAKPKSQSSANHALLGSRAESGAIVTNASDILSNNILSTNATDPDSSTHPSIDPSRVPNPSTNNVFQPLPDQLVLDQTNLNPTSSAVLDKLAPATDLDISEPGQVTSVDQLSDVQPSDWAYQALQSLVERYGCIVGYPDRTYKGQRALTRYEFAAGLNACLDRISELIANSTADRVKKEDLARIRRLQAQYAIELASLRGRVDGLEARTADLAAHQFSTTTTLKGTTIFAIGDLLSGSVGDAQPFFQYRTDLALRTSFTGRDALVAVLRTGNVPTLSSGFGLPSSQVNLRGGGAFDVSSAEGTLASQYGANLGGTFKLIKLNYSFPVGEQLSVIVAGGGLTPLNEIAPTLNPFLDDNDGGTGAITVFGERNPIYSLGSGVGLGLNYFISRQLRLSAAYLADGLNVGDPRSGLFSGGYAALGQLTWTPSKSFGIGATYVNSYFPTGRFGFNYNSFAVSGTAVANTLAGQSALTDTLLGGSNAVITNSYGLEATWSISPKFVLSGWFGATYARLIRTGDGEILNYALTLAFPDFGIQGNLLGLVIGAEPYLTRFRGGNPSSFKTDIPLHIEAFYRFQFNDNISVTPGIVWLVNPNQDSSNSDGVIATLRTTFKF